MNIYIKQSELKAAVADAAKALSGNTPVPITKHLLITPRLSGYLDITGTDTRTWIERTVQAVVTSGDDPTPFTVDAAHIQNLLGRLPKGADVQITRKDGDNKVQLRCGTVDCTLVGLPAEQFPTAPASRNPRHGFKIPGAAFAALVKGVAFIPADVDRDDTVDPWKKCVALQTNSIGIKAAATDRKRIAEKHKPLDSAYIMDYPALVPADALTRILPVVEDYGLEVSFGDNLLHIEGEDVVRVTTALIQEGMPNYQRVIPEDYELVQTFDREELLGVLERASLYAESDTHRITLVVSERMLDVFGENGNVGRFHEEIWATDIDGEIKDTHGFNFNVRDDYIIGALKAVNWPHVRLGWNGESGKGVSVRPAANDDHLCYVVKLAPPMPTDPEGIALKATETLRKLDEYEAGLAAERETVAL